MTAAPQSRGQPAPPDRSRLSGIGAAVIFLAVVVAGVLVRIFREILAPLVVAAFLLLLIDALARDLDNRFPRAPALARGATAGVLIVAGFAAVVMLLVLQGPPFALQLAAIEPRLNQALAELSGLAGQAPVTVHQLFRGADPGRVLGRVFVAARGAVRFAGLALIYLGFLAASRRAFSSKLDRLYESQQQREQARFVFGSIRSAVERYVRLVTFKALLIALVALVVMVALGVNYALFVAFLVFLCAFVPIVGAFAGALIPALVALAQFSDATRPAFIVVGLGGAVLLIDNVLMPMLQGDELNIDPLLVLISIGFWGVLLGPTGVLLSTPLSVMAMVIAAEFEGAHWLAVLISKDGEPVKMRTPRAARLRR
ncbi:MAG TPA: AI-2E family transporter [Caulobacteraceae bacterium]|nr:AI-2E family transporter [Caulobacteraceae bacterium]